jgi:alpha-methylacyl-CoA racemase
MFLTIGVLAALLERVTSGRGQVIDAAMIDGAALLMSPIYAQWSTGSWVDVREANIMDGGAPFYRCYRTRDGGFMSVAAVEPAFYANFLRVLLLDGVSPSAQWNRARWPEVAQQIAGEFSKRTRSYWVEAFQDVEACVEPVLGIAESFRHPQAVARGLFNVVDGLVQVSPAPRFSRTPNKTPNHWARSGEHTVEIRDEVRNEAVNVRRGPSPL